MHIAKSEIEICLMMNKAFFLAIGFCNFIFPGDRISCFARTFVMPAEFQPCGLRRHLHGRGVAVRLVPF